MYRELYTQLEGVRGATHDVSHAVLDALKQHHTQQAAAMKGAVPMRDKTGLFVEAGLKGQAAKGGWCCGKVCYCRVLRVGNA